jgi:hypothetical protein
VDEAETPIVEEIEAPIVDDTCWLTKGVLEVVEVIGADVVAAEVALNMVAMERKKGAVDPRPLMTKGNESRRC